MIFSNIFIDMNIPFLMASFAFLMVCLLSMGILIHIRELSYRRSVIKKIRSADDDWALIEKDSTSLTSSGSSGSGNVFMNILRAIGLKANPGRSTDDPDIKLKFLRAGLRG